MRVVAALTLLSGAAGLVAPRPHLTMSTILHSSRDGQQPIGTKRQLIRAKSQELGKTLLQKAKERRPSLVRGVRRAVSDFRDVSNEVMDYTIASAQLSRQNLLAWAQAFGALAACAAVGAATASGSAAAFPELVGRFGASRALAARATMAVFALGFGIALRQNKALIGRNGLAPYHKVLERVERNRTSTWSRVEAVPSLLWLSKNRTDSALTSYRRWVWRFQYRARWAARCTAGAAWH